jgi:glycosyltransferase involved in cell wall biosynthesis
VRVLLLAPHPFYQDRGTPIAVDMLLRVLSGSGIHVDVVTFPEGEDRNYEHVRIHRVSAPGNPGNVRPGFSLRKVYLDLFLFFRARKLLRAGAYDLVHAVEESAFMARTFWKRYGIPYIYDMDSMLSEQLIARLRFLAVFGRLFRAMESAVIRDALVVVPMCEDLATRVARYRSEDVMVVKDVSLIDNDAPKVGVEDVRESFGLDGVVIMYVGNLETYQGVDLLIESFCLVREAVPNASLVIIGGAKAHIEHYSGKIAEQGIGGCVYLLGPRPVEHIGAYLCQADILVSPRCEGTNTPMKIYSYLHSGVPIVATDLPTHTQVLSRDNSVLVDPDVKDFADGIIRLARDETLRREIGEFARAYAEDEHGFEHFKASVTGLYERISIKLKE